MRSVDFRQPREQGPGLGTRSSSRLLFGIEKADPGQELLVALVRTQGTVLRQPAVGMVLPKDLRGSALRWPLWLVSWLPCLVEHACGTGNATRPCCFIPCTVPCASCDSPGRAPGAVDSGRGCCLIHEGEPVFRALNSGVSTARACTGSTRAWREGTGHRAAVLFMLLSFFELSNIALPSSRALVLRQIFGFARPQL